MQGDVLTAYYTNAGTIRRLVVEGQPATWRQLPDDREVYDEASAERIEYDAEAGTILLLRSVELKHNNVVVTGERVEYDLDEERAIVYNNPQGLELEEGEVDRSQKEKVRVTLPPSVSEDLVR